MFRTLLFHEVRPDVELTGKQRPLMVADGYEDSLPLPLFDSLTLFKERINYLKENNYHFLSLQEVKDFYQNKTSLPENSVLITFDDCFQSMKQYAYPVLKEANVKANAFVVSGWLFSEPSIYESNLSKTLSIKDLEEMSDVFDYANHTDHFHERRGTTLSKPMWENEDLFKKDLMQCNQTQLIEHKDIFAYPFGLYNQQTVESLRDMSFDLAFTTIPGINTLETNPLELRRDMVPANMSIETFSQLMEA